MNGKLYGVYHSDSGQWGYCGGIGAFFFCNEFGVDIDPDDISNNATPWYSTCTARAVFKGVGSALLDGVGILPEGGAVSAAFSFFHGAAGISNGSKILERVAFATGLISTANAASEASGESGAFSIAGAQTVTGAAAIGAGLARATPIVGQVLSGLAVAEDLYSTYKAVKDCH
jgi:hypothetical protein